MYALYSLKKKITNSLLNKKFQNFVFLVGTYLPRKYDNFNYIGFVSKTQTLKEIINTISYYIDGNLIKTNSAILS